jgi:PemK-like, MazF-like toxin of type II toxin-antitoxin system
VVRLPDAALAQLLTLQLTLIEPGEIYWLPAELVVYGHPRKRRPCLVAATDGARAHLVPGTSKQATGPALTVEVGETHLIQCTEFDFSTSFPLPLRDIAAKGKTAGSLPAARLADIDAAIKLSNLVALKRLVAT